MQIPQIFVQKKTIMIEIAVLIVVLALGYYLYSIMSEDSASVTETQMSEQLLGKNLTLFLKSKNQDKLSFKDISFMDTELVKQLKDFTETILPNSSRGRLDPFAPYASSRPIR